MTASDLLRALGPVVDALDALGVPHYVGGSLASSAHGIPRTSIDADVVADLGLDHVRGLVDRLRELVLAKLEWFRAGGEASDRKWGDIVGVLKTRSGALDYDYLKRWSVSLGVEDLLDRARREE